MIHLRWGMTILNVQTIMTLTMHQNKNISLTSCKISFGKYLMSPSSTLGSCIEVTWPRSPAWTGIKSALLSQILYFQQTIKRIQLKHLFRPKNNLICFLMLHGDDFCIDMGRGSWNTPCTDHNQPFVHIHHSLTWCPLCEHCWYSVAQ